MSKLVESEMNYWFAVVKRHLQELEDWNYPDEATLSLLRLENNQEYIDDEIEYPILRWRQLDESN